MLNQQLQKSGAMKFSSGHVAVRTACSNFTAAFHSITDLLVQIRRNGTGPLVDAISSSFDDIFGALRQLHPNSVHDPLGKVLKSLTQQTQSVRRAALRRVIAASGPLDDAQVLAEMRPLRQLADDIAQTPLDSDQVRGRVLTACNDLLQAVRGGLLFAGDISIISTTFEEFRRSLDTVAMLLEVPVGNIPMELRGFEEANRDEALSLDDGMDLVSALALGHELLVRWFGASGKLVQMFELFKRKAVELETTAKDLAKQNAALAARCAKMKGQIDDTTTTDTLKKLCGDVHVYATGQRLEDVPADDIHLLRQIRIDAEALDQQKSKTAEMNAKGALAGIVGGSDLVAVAQSVQSQYFKLDMQVQSDQMQFAKILCELGQTKDVRNSDEAMNWIIAAIQTQREAVKQCDARIAAEIDKAEKAAASLAERCGYEPSTPLPALIAKAGDELASDREMLQQVREKLAAFLKTDDAPVPTLLSKLDSSDDPRLIALESRLRAMVPCEAPPVADCYARIGGLVDAIQEELQTAQRGERARQVYLVKPRALVEATLQKLRRSLGLDPAENARALEMESMLEQMSELCDQIGAETSMASQISINYMFENAFPYFSPTSRTNPAVYIPEFCREFVVQAKSIKALQPFNGVLDEIFKTFDCKMQSFNPKTESFVLIRDKSFALQKLLNETGSKPVHASVFTMLSNFISLLSGFISALSCFGADVG
jgi:hypothetical protein